MGIDPGQNGGIATIDEYGVRLSPMPDTDADIWEMIATTFWASKCVAYLEQVHAMPKQGVSSTFKFGCGYGGLRMALTAALIPFELVTPQRWQKGLGIVNRGKDEPIGKWKDRLRAKAQQLYPDVADLITRKTADALLIAEFRRRMEKA